MTLVLLVVSATGSNDGLELIGLSDSGWTRIVAPTPGGRLDPRRCLLNEQTMPRSMDLIELNAPWRDPRPGRTENVVAGPGMWTLLERPASRPWLARIATLPSAPGPLLGNAAASLAAAVLPSQTVAWVRLEDPRNGEVSAGAIWDSARLRYQSRLRLHRAGVLYDLPLLDPSFNVRLLADPGEFRSLSAWGLRAPHGAGILLSLGEPFRGRCFKLVTGIIPIRVATLWRDASSPRSSSPIRNTLDRPLAVARASVGRS